LVKLISYYDYLDDEGKKPYSMTVEIIKKYKGSEGIDTIKVWRDNEVEYSNYFL